VHGDQEDGDPLSRLQVLSDHLQGADVRAELLVVAKAHHNFAPTAGPPGPSREAVLQAVAHNFDATLGSSVSHQE
jgi:hypothetical protein